MADSEHNAVLNQLLINLNRSLLQYVGDAWPWTADSAKAERDKLDELIARQQTQITCLTKLLEERDWAVEFGSYPTEYTDLHYVALDYLLSQLIENEQGLITDIQQTLDTCADDAQAVSLLGDILAEQREIVGELQELEKPRSVGNAA